jgi:hypothetical protein
VIREIEEEPEPISFNFNIFEVIWAESVELLDENEESPDWEAGCGPVREGERSARLDFTNVDTKDKSVSPAEVRVNEVDGVFDKISVLVWGMEAVTLGVESGLGSEKDNCWILVRNIVFTESTEPWPSTSWLATKSVKFSNTISKSTFEEAEAEESVSRTWTMATEFNDPNTDEDKKLEEISSDWAWLNERETKPKTESLELRDNSEGEWVTAERDDNKDNTFPSLTSASSAATLNKPITSWERISRRVDISEIEIAQSPPVKPDSQEQLASHILSIKPQVKTRSPESEFTNSHTPWPEQSGALQLWLFIAHRPEEQLSQLKQSEFELQLLEPEPSTKLDSLTQSELSSPDTPTYPDKQDPQVLVVEEQSLRLCWEQGVGSKEQSFQFMIELNKETDCIVPSEFEAPEETVSIDVDFSIREAADIGEEGKVTTTETRDEDEADKLSYTPTQQSKR